MKSLRDKVKELSNTLPLMEGREKGDMDDLIDEIVTITDYGFMQGDDGNYVAFTIKEDKEKFFFGGMVLTGDMEILESDGYRSEIIENGLPILLSNRISKSKRNYIACEFYP